MISFRGVFVPGVLGGFTLEVRGPLTFLVEPEGERAARTIFRLLAGLTRPHSGTIELDGKAPLTDPALRRSIALLGDAAMLEGLSDREVRAMLASFVSVRDAPPVTYTPDRVAMTDALAVPARARVVLLAHPERYADPERRMAALDAMHAAIARGAQAIVATHRLDSLLALAHPDPNAPAHLLMGGRVGLTAPAQHLPWAAPAHGGVTRAVHVECPDPLGLSTKLLSDADASPLIALVEPLGARAVRLHARDARGLVRIIARMAHGGLAIDALSVIGASAHELMGGAR